MAKAKFLWFTLLVVSGINHNAIGQANSVLASGSWIKLSLVEENIYKVTYTDLQSYGLDPDNIDPASISIYGNGGGMLPQANNVPRPADLVEMAIAIIGGNDGKFDTNDYIVFYGTGPDLVEFDSTTNTFRYQNHLFTNTNYYYLTINKTNGKRLTTSPSIAGGNSITSAYKVAIHEVEQINILHSGRQWFGEKFDLETTQTFATGVTDIDPASEIKLISSVMSTSLQDATFTVKINGSEIGTQSIAANPEGTYATKGTIARDTFAISKASINDAPIDITYTFSKEFGVGYLDYFVLQTKNILTYAGTPIIFYTGDLANQGNITFSIANCPSGLLLWDITNHNATSEIKYTQTGSTITFNAAKTSQKFILFNPANDLAKPSAFEQIANQNLHSSSATDFLILTPELFYTQAQTIAALREAEGLNVKIATPEQVFNEFSSGKPDITAIRDYAKQLYDNAGLKYLLMFGKGTYDPKDILESGLHQLPIYESRNALQPLATYGSDDYLGFMEDEEGEWQESRSGDHTMDIGVGRIPATTIAEADNFVKKLQNYQNKYALGAWRKDVVFIAENGDLNLHQRDAERLATLVDTTYAAFNTNKIYIDAYQIEVSPGKRRAPTANEDIYNTINKGALIINYTGHGNEIQWAKTRIFDKNVIDTLLNSTYLPLFVTATCEFGRHDDTGNRSGGEDLMVKKETGAIATITTARPVFSSTNYQLNVAFYSEVFNQPNGDFQRLGDVFKKTKNNSLNGVLNRNFSLLGDPSMKLSYPKQPISIDSLNGEVVISSDTLSALRELNFKGSIRNINQTIDSSFNGELLITIHDKSTIKQTLGNLGATPFKYKVRDNILFQGKSSIINGTFSFSTVLPKDISYSPGAAKFTLYAHKNDSSQDAGGANIEMLIGNSATSPIIDNIPPEINLYFGDTNFVKGMVVNPNTLLIAKLSDENGINTSITQVGHSIIYTIDDYTPVILNDFYSTAIDNHQEGWIYYNLPPLTPGKHLITFTAWDTSNNSTTITQEFYVSENDEIIISELSNYPNPMQELTNFTFAHNLAGEDLEITLEIINTSGKHIYQQKRSYNSAPAVINDWPWDGRNSFGGKINAGIYIYGIIIRSKSSNLTQTKYSRLFIAN